MHFLSKMQFLLNIFNDAFSRYLILRVSHCQGNSRRCREELWKRVSDAESRDRLGAALDHFKPWPLVLSDSEAGQGCGSAPSSLLPRGRKAEKVRWKEKEPSQMYL